LSGGTPSRTAAVPVDKRLRLKRLWQPGSLLFWQMVGFNVLSSVCAWALRALPLNTTGVLLVGTLGLLNCAFGMLAAWRLLQTPAPGEAPTAAPPR
jgi:hypothetical protein